VVKITLFCNKTPFPENFFIILLNNLNVESSQLQINFYGEIKEYLKKILSPILLFIGIVKQDSNITTGTLWSIFNWASYLIAEKSDTDYKESKIKHGS